MKLYLTPGACSLADHIALTEAGIQVETVKVDLSTRRTEHGEDYTAVNPKGYVPALVFDDGEVLTENVAIMDWVARARRPAWSVAQRRNAGRPRHGNPSAIHAFDVLTGGRRKAGCARGDRRAAGADESATEG